MGGEEVGIINNITYGLDRIHLRLTRIRQHNHKEKTIDDPLRRGINKKNIDSLETLLVSHIPAINKLYNIDFSPRTNNSSLVRDVLSCERSHPQAHNEENVHSKRDHHNACMRCQDRNKM